MMKQWILVLAMAAAAMWWGCGNSRDKALFTLLEADECGVDFVNTLPEEEGWNIVKYLYYYNGGGVAVGDVNGDSLPDVYMSSNRGPNKLYINKGNMRFEAGTALPGTGNWKTGVSMADVNGDGHLDIYQCVASGYKTLSGKNQLYINDGKGRFAEQAATWGLDVAALSSQAAWLDYDKDGDLDMFLLCHSVHDTEQKRDTSLRQKVDPLSGDRLFRNDGSKFTDVSREAGIYGGKLGYGLGIVVSDVNNDGFEDIYITNDFHENDYLYYGTGKGFRESLGNSMGHTSYFSMGCDAADINNDGWPDMVSLDMKPDDETVLKASQGADPYNIYDMKLKFGFEPQFPRNCLQLNRGALGPSGNAVFSEVGYFATMAATDWSWSALFADYDLDGFRDLYITNGIVRRPDDLDYLKYQQTISDKDSDLSILRKMPQRPVSNFAFKNRNGMAMDSITADWGLQQYGFSGGAAYADFDGDGDLDMVVNNINEKAYVYRNNAREQRPEHHFLRIRLEGDGQNRFGVGARIELYRRDSIWMCEQSPVRGWQSSVDYTQVVGLGKVQTLDSVRVRWPDGRTQVLPNIKSNQTLTLRQSNAKGVGFGTSNVGGRIFVNVSATAAPNVVHKENNYLDSDQEKLIPRLLSTEGPCLATADVNGDGLTDLYFGGATGQPGYLVLQQKDGFKSKPVAFDGFIDREETDAAFFDADGDGDSDLYVATGGNQYPQGSEKLADILYLNDGKGNFKATEGAMPGLRLNGSCVKPADFDGDGDTDLFVGTRSVPGQYGMAPKSVLLRNDGKGPSLKFTDVTRDMAPLLDSIGMVTDAVWLSLNGDKLPDLVVVGEWMPITMFKSNGGKKLAPIALTNSEGWWNCIAAADLDNDGDTDLVAGNLGLNTNLQASNSEPLSLYIADFDRNGATDPVMAYYRHHREHLYVSRDELAGQMPIVKKLFPEYHAFANSSFSSVFLPEQLQAARLLQARELASVMLINRGNGEFEQKNLSQEAQLAPIFSILVHDFDGDKQPDILLGGNSNEFVPSIGRCDASVGTYLRGLGKGNFEALPPARTGLVLRGSVRGMALVRNSFGNLNLVVARNTTTPQVFLVQ